jgi:peptide deformylase
MQLEIVDIDDPIKNKVLTTPMESVTFPLTEEDKRFIEALKSKVSELNAAGLAAPQVGAAKPITAFEVSQEALKWREDITHLVPLTVLINPSYEPIENEGLSLDWEGCFSGKNYYGKVWRYKAIQYKGQDVNGHEIERIAVGFLARLLQHEIDHCNHKMCIHNYDGDSPHGSQADLMHKRKEEVRQKKEKLGLGPDDPFPLLEIK